MIPKKLDGARIAPESLVSVLLDQIVGSALALCRTLGLPVESQVLRRRGLTLRLAILAWGYRPPLPGHHVEERRWVLQGSPRPCPPEQGHACWQHRPTSLSCHGARVPLARLGC